MDANELPFQKADFGEGFAWGATLSAFQAEGACNIEGKGEDIWHRFTANGRRVKDKTNAFQACDFYNRYPHDLGILNSMGMGHFRFSIAWSRILPTGEGLLNPKGVAYYDRVIDTCLSLGIEPWVTLYHWDLPYALHQYGGWTNRRILDAFSHYADVIARLYGDRVKRWIVLNEPSAFTALGYLVGYHAPGKLGMDNFMKALHHALLASADGYRILKAHSPKAEVGNSYSCFHVTPASDRPQDVKAAHVAETIFNRLYVEPSLGLGYPVKDVPALQPIEKLFKPGDEQRLVFTPDFVGVQNYTRQVVKHSRWVPFVGLTTESPRKKGLPVTEMGWEVYPEGIYHSLKFFAAYPGVNKLYVTESGVAYPDVVQNGRVHDSNRIAYFRDYLAQTLRAKREGVPVEGYLVWSLLDNFEWVEGYKPRFGLVHVDFHTQERTLKDSGYWFRQLLTGEPMPPGSFVG